MNLDRQLLETQPDRVAAAITDGIWCFIDQVRGGVSVLQSAASPAIAPPEGGG